MKKAFALIPGELPEELYGDEKCNYEDYENPIRKEVLAITTRFDERLVGLHRHEGAGYWPMTLKEFEADDDDYIEVFVSEQYHQLSTEDLRENYVWSTVINDDYEIRDGLNNDNLLNMKGEIEI